MSPPRCPTRCRLPFLLLALSIGVLAPGCHRDTTAVMQATAESRLLVGNGVEPATLDPHLNTGSPESNIIGALWEPLVQWNDTGTALIPAAATAWELSPDGRVYTFHLRRDARWSNGDLVTAPQWVRSFQRLLDPAIGAEFASVAFDLQGAEAFYTGQKKDPTSVGVSAPDDYTLVLQLRSPNPAFLGFLISYPWLPVHLPSVEAAGGLNRRDTHFTRPGVLITNGPFQLAEWRPNQFVRVVANPYFHSPPRLREVRFFAIESVDSEERSYRSGQLHLTSSLPPSKIPVYRAAGDPALRLSPRVGTHFLFLNTTHGPLQDARVRRALALAIDRQQLVSAVLGGGERPAHSIVYPIAGGYEPALPALDTVGEAQRLLAEAGFPGGQGFPAVEYLYNTSERNRDVAQALQQMWLRHLGIRVTLRNEEWKVFVQSRRDGNFQIARAGWLAFTPEPIEMFQMAVSDSSLNDSRWTNARYDEIYRQAKETLEMGARRSRYAELDALLHEEMPLIPLATYSLARLVHPDVQNWPDNPQDARSWQKVAVGAAP